MSTLNPPEKKPVALIAGPTASGKSHLAVELAQRLARAGRRGVIVNADSQQVYRDLTILSARPTVGEMGGIEHRLFGTWDGAEACSAADWAAAAKDVIADVHGAGDVPILCGGTGLYLRTLLDGIAPVPEIDPDIRESVRALPQADARSSLEREDPGAAARLAPADATRTTRALEVVRSTGRTLAEWQAQKTGGSCAPSACARSRGCSKANYRVLKLSPLARPRPVSMPNGNIRGSATSPRMNGRARITKLLSSAIILFHCFTITVDHAIQGPYWVPVGPAL